MYLGFKLTNMKAVVVTSSLLLVVAMTVFSTPYYSGSDCLSGETPRERNRRLMKQRRAAAGAQIKRMIAKRQAEVDEELRKRNEDSKRAKRARYDQARYEQRTREAEVEVEFNFLGSKEKSDVIDTFESLTKSVKHKWCQVCLSCSVSLEMSRTPGICKSCRETSATRQSLLEANLLPIWYDSNNVVHYEAPDVLSRLNVNEKMLIQRVSLFVPLKHLKSGSFGLKGHACCFPQDIGPVCDVLPRLPANVSIVKYIKTYKQHIGDVMTTKSFKVRRKYVLEALYWLKSHHPGKFVDASKLAT